MGAGPCVPLRGYLDTLGMPQRYLVGKLGLERGQFPDTAIHTASGVVDASPS